MAKELQKRIKDSKLIPIVSLLKQETIEIHGETVGFVFPLHGMMVFDVHTPADVMLTIRKYTLKDVVQYIKADMLIIDSESDYTLKGQAKKLYDNLKSPKDFYLFTKDQSAQAHCQMGAIAISNEVIFNWLDKIMK